MTFIHGITSLAASEPYFIPDGITDSNTDPGSSIPDLRPVKSTVPGTYSRIILFVTGYFLTVYNIGIIQNIKPVGVIRILYGNMEITNGNNKLFILKRTFSAGFCITDTHTDTD